MKKQKNILVIIVLSQFFCTTLWFVGNSILSELISVLDISENDLGHLVSAVQFGFIMGTLVFAILNIADRFSPSIVFFVCAWSAALCNVILIFESNVFASIISLRFATGFFLAGIYPVGMKIAADYYEKELGKSLGFLVGALVLGTAFPHLFKGLANEFYWKNIVILTSVIAGIGGLMMTVFVPDGPFRRKGQSIDFSAFFKVFRSKTFKSAAFGYFGHMWELYAFWTFVPVILSSYSTMHNELSLNIPMCSFLIIGIGSIACVLSGYLSEIFGAKKIAFWSLLLSCICCLTSPLFFSIDAGYIFVGFLMFWGMVVVADSPLFSTMVAQNAPAEIKGTALTIVNCIGFAITIISIQLLTISLEYISPVFIFTILSIGPILGLLALRRAHL